MIADSPKLAHKFEVLHIFFRGKIGDQSMTELSQSLGGRWGEGGSEGGGTQGQFGWRCAADD